ncbi:putative transcriptional regulator [Actinacidiphila reveromycinica]|uniref:Putative transcriptional regulator n=1 Tax=Actinacidiphila reveromycinica TaxID=659352 RepID=G1UDV5_9ACTN|nr:LuxR family transcriptional regulator [Streptomyces sp. SN-593]BAK64651.1 putative transcriptional regulator [Streptomyces sp. SN-593]BBB01308.1 putative transcriptional regulator [Streptomyces sp. SN-593]
MLERDQCLDQLTELLDTCAEGNGATGVISGAVGFGKTTLLEAVVSRAAARGYMVLGAVGSKVESAIPYAVVEQLFQSAELAGAETDLHVPLQRAKEEWSHLGMEAGAAQAMQAYHALLVELSAHQPVVLCVDDIQHVDSESLACLLYLIRRCRRNPVTILLTLGPSGAAPCEGVLAELACRPGVAHVRLGAFDEVGMARLIADRFGPAAAEQYAPGFYAMSGGNPLLAQALVSDHTARPAHPETGYHPVAADLFREASVACTRRSGLNGLRVARGLAITNGAGSSTLLARLVGLEKRDVDAAMKILTESRLIEGLRFRHPAIRSAVLDNMSAVDRTRLHHRVAGLLRNDGAPVIVVAQHLIAAGAVEDDWAPQFLMDAAKQALREDRVSLAEQCLQLADNCCQDQGRSHAIKANLARIKWRDQPEAAARIMLSLVAPARAGDLPGSLRLKVAHRLLVQGRVTDAVELMGPLFAGGADGTPAERLTLELDVTRLWLAFTYPGVHQQLVGDLPPEQQRQVPSHQIGRPRLSAIHTLWAVLKRGPDDVLVAEAERVLQHLLAEDDTISSLNSAIAALVYADRLESAAAWCGRLQTAATERHAPTWHALFTSTRAMIALRRGSLRSAAESAEAALRSMSVEAWGVEIGMPLATAIEARTAMGDHAASAELVNSPVPPGLFQTRFGLHYLYARGRHYLATGYYDAALADFIQCGEKAQEWDLDSPALAPWRTGAVEVWLQRGQRERAGRLADEHLALVKRGQRRTLGVALRVQAMTRPSSQQAHLLGTAVDMLQTAGDRYELALTLVELCRTHQRQGAAAQARLLVRQAWRMASECGAEGLCSSLMPKPVAGVPVEQPRSLPPSDDVVAGVLSEAELRVCSLAARGHTNREISDKLFVTVSTVEQHLTRAYRKLNIRHRRELPASLAS